jgi:hypothetical protein
MEMNTVPGYGAAGTFRRALYEALSSRVFFDLSFGPDGMEQLQLRVVF